MTLDRMHRETGPDAAFDAAARDAHAQALDRLSPRVRAQLAQRRRAALSGPRPSPLRAWPMLALGSAAVLALAIGVFVLPGDRDVAPAPGPSVAVAPVEPSPATPGPVDTAPDIAANAPPADATPTAAAPTDVVPADDVPADVVDVASLPDTWLAAEFEDASSGLEGFDENPDFYVWLASDEGLAEVTESL
ncbi:MAG: hypothetical protein ACOY82_13550 [Pseudomonadota bacterium]